VTQVNCSMCVYIQATGSCVVKSIKRNKRLYGPLLSSYIIMFMNELTENFHVCIYIAIECIIIIIIKRECPTAIDSQNTISRVMMQQAT